MATDNDFEESRSASINEGSGSMNAEEIDIRDLLRKWDQIRQLAGLPSIQKREGGGDQAER